MYSFIYSFVHLLIINRETGLINECPRPTFFDLSYYTLLPQRLVYARSTKPRGVFFKVGSSATASVTFTKATNSSDHVCWQNMIIRKIVSRWNMCIWHDKLNGSISIS